AQLRHELALISDLEYAPYFLTVNNIVRFARSKDILCQGRGSAANSAVCYVLGITSIDPVRSGLLFERFVSQARREPPDIDVDFEHERREEVIQWVYETYGRERAALCATVIRYRTRGAVRDVGKAMGLTEDVTTALASQAWGWSEEGIPEEQAAELNLNLADRRLRLTLDLSHELIGFPRHLSQHPGGFVLTHDRLDELVPIEPAAMDDRQVIEWDKDDIDHLRFMKVDVLGLGMLGCMRRAFDLLRAHRGLPLDLGSIPAEDKATYAMIQKADTLGTFQIESRAQMSMLPRLKPATFYDLVIEVAIVRPGPIQGDMVHPYLRRREGKDPVEYPTPELKRVLGKTLGVPLFQEQAMQVAIVCAGFTATEADALRRSMATFKVTGGVSKFQEKMITGMVANGYSREFAERTFKQIEGFGSYGFPESHAASFALIAYASCWLKRHHPDVFCVALLNSQPMGFYAPAQIVADAKAHGVPVRPVCINASSWDCTLEPAEGRYLAVRLGLRMVTGLSETHAAALIASRGVAPYSSVEDVWRRAAVPIAALERLADADAYQGLGLARRQALWAIRGLDNTELPLMAAAGPPAVPSQEREPKVRLRPMPAGGEVVADYWATGLTLRDHPVSFVRAEVQRLGAVPCARLTELRPGRRVAVAGIVLVRQRPGSARGVIFATIEDETGHANIIVWPKVFDRQRRIVVSARMLACRGLLQREGDVIHVVAEELTDLSDLLASVGQRGTAFWTADAQVTQGAGPARRDMHDRSPAESRSRLTNPETLKVTTRDFH
ncbi:MAG: error-prone DNA polymerase, partial [Acetobacteraceae bacterium]